MTKNNNIMTLTRSEYDERFDQCRVEGAIDVLESLFGTALFNDEKEVDNA